MDKKRWSLLLRSILSIALIAALAYHVGSAAILSRLASVQWHTVVLAVLILTTSFLFVTPRWRMILDAFGHRIPARQLVGSVLLGFLFNQLLPTAVGGEVIRIWRTRQLGVPLDVSIYSVLVDRASGVMAAFGGALLLLPFAQPREGYGTLMALLALVATAGAFGCIVLLVIGRVEAARSPIPTRLHQSLQTASSSLRALLGQPAAGAGILLFACINQGLPVATIWLFGRDLGLGLNAIDIAFVTLISTLSATLPLSFAGWGIREGALVYLFGLYGVPADVALAVSILYGVSQTIAAAPGALLLLGGFKQPPADQ